MKITFLGTSHGIPSDERYCSSILAEVGDNYYLLDAGAPVGDLIPRMGLDWSKFRAVFNTHPHGDHFLGLLSFVDLVNWYYGGTNVDIFVPREGQVKFIHDMSMVTENRPLSERINVQKFTEGMIYEDEYVTVRADLTDHLDGGGGDFLSYAFTITEKATGKCFLYAGDCDEPLADVERITTGNHYDLAVFECAHFSTDYLEQRFAVLDADKAAIVHVAPLDKYEIFKTWHGKFSLELLTPSDGDTVVL